MMQPHRARLLLATLLVAAVACSSNDERPPAAGSDSGSGASSHAGKTAASGGHANAGEDAVAEGGAGDAQGGASEGGASPIGHLGGLGPANVSGGSNATPAECDQVTWSEPVALASVSTPGADETLLAMTHDELTLLFSRGEDLFVVDRASATAAFAAPVAVTLPVGYTHQYGLGLSPDGLRLVAVSDTTDALADVSRSARQGSFDGEPSTARYDSIAYNAAQFGQYLSWPVLAQSGESLYYTALSGDGSVVYHARGKASFAVPLMSEDAATLGGSDGDLKLTVSVSADERIVFVLDEALGHAVGLRSSAPGAPYDTPVAFEGLRGAFTNAGCTRLYGTLDDAGALDVVIQTAE
jgi:hypothetical protein